MDERDLIERLRGLADGSIEPSVAQAHLEMIDATVPATGTRPRHLVAAAVAFALLTAGAVTAVNRADDDRQQPVSSVSGEDPSDIDSSPAVETHQP